MIFWVQRPDFQLIMIISGHFKSQLASRSE
jgi:hypothetical protein